jgi:succinyl-diaminopimelate desuccinylase
MFDFLRTAERMIATPSVTGEGTAEIVRFLAQAVIPHLPGDPVALPETNGTDVSLLVAVPGAEKLPPLLLNSHLDTVGPGDRRAWTATGGNPFRPRRDGDRLIGLGSADAKLDWLCKAEAVRRTAAGGRLRRPILLLGTHGEERGQLGARSFLERGVMPRPSLALIGEPTECTLVTRHKGMLMGQLELQAEAQRVTGSDLTSRVRRYRGRAAHAATPGRGESAILKALEEIADETPVVSIRGGDAPNRVAAACDVEVATTRRRRTAAAVLPTNGRVSPMSPALLVAARDFVAALPVLGERESGEDPAFSPPNLTTNIGCVEGRGDRLVLTFDLYSLPGTDLPLLERRIEGLARSLQGRYAGLRARVVIQQASAALRQTPKPFVEMALAAMGAAGLARRVGTRPECSEAGLYAAAGIPAVVFGAGRGDGNIHAPNEWTSVSQLRQAVDFYVAFIGSYCMS